MAKVLIRYADGGTEKATVEHARPALLDMIADDLEASDGRFFILPSNGVDCIIFVTQDVRSVEISGDLEQIAAESQRIAEEEL